MSQIDGVFSLETPEDLLVKLESDFARMQGAEPTSRDAQFAAFDFFVTAEHMVDWLSVKTGDSKSSLRAYPDGAMVHDVASGAKHFHVDPKRHDTVLGTRSAGYFDPAIFDPAIFDPAIFDVGRLVVDCQDGATVNVMDVAARVVDHWRAMIRP